MGILGQAGEINLLEMLDKRGITFKLPAEVYLLSCKLRGKPISPFISQRNLVVAGDWQECLKK
jgi:hypothetical protein